MNTSAHRRFFFATSLLAPLMLWLAGVTTATGQVITNVLVPQTALWLYRDDGANLGNAWRALNYDDSAWPAGYAQLGFGDNDEETVINRGPEGGQFITYYFRHSFDVTLASTYTNLTLSVLRDDGVVIYLNGVYVWRDNMPEGAIDHRTLASTVVGGTVDENVFHTINLPGKYVRNGRNVVAVEVHQASTNSSDLSFDFQLTGGSLVPKLVRGPYLQSGGTTNIVIRWRTDLPCDSVVRYGQSLFMPGLTMTNAALTNEHEIALTGLVPNTLYYYTIGHSEQTLAGDSSHHFVTAPTNAKPTRIWVQGDSGTADVRPLSVYNAYRTFTGERPTDLWLMLGDNAYGTGTDAQYQAAVFNLFPELLRQTVLWSTIGNHETYSGTFEDFPFLHIFTQPQNGEAGGVASGTERYYSFDYGNIHFICLDAMTSDRSSGGPMCTWLLQDLEASDKEWLIAFWHHPPYTRGSHNSDWETELVEMRQNVLPILESHSVDLVLCGHSHCYERSFLINGHYGLASTFDPGNPGMMIDGGSGREDGTGAYRKPDAGPEPSRGTVYVVAGSSGQATFGPLDHPVMFFDELRLGSLVIDVDGPTLRAKFLRETGAIDDYFTILKGAAANELRIVSHQLTNGLLNLKWQTQTGKSYILERTIRLTPPNWMEVSAGMPGNGDLISVNVPVGANPTGAYFRVRSFPD